MHPKALGREVTRRNGEPPALPRPLHSAPVAMPCWRSAEQLLEKVKNPLEQLLVFIKREAGRR